jgi:hypothetical protein
MLALTRKQLGRFTKGELISMLISEHADNQVGCILVSELFSVSDCLLHAQSDLRRAATMYLSAHKEAK